MGWRGTCQACLAALLRCPPLGLSGWSASPPPMPNSAVISQSLYSGERGIDFLRQVALQGNQLVLLAKTREMDEDHTRKLTWQRLP
jgi:hypothetical protein